MFLGTCIYLEHTYVRSQRSRSIHHPAAVAVAAAEPAPSVPATNVVAALLRVRYCCVGCCCVGSMLRCCCCCFRRLHHVVYLVGYVYSTAVFRKRSTTGRGGDKPYLHTLKRRTCTHAHTHTATGRYLLQCCRGCLRVTRDTPVCGTAEQALPGMWDPRRLLLLVCRLHYWRVRAVCCRQTGGGGPPCHTLSRTRAHAHTTRNGSRRLGVPASDGPKQERRGSRRCAATKCCRGCCAYGVVPVPPCAVLLCRLLLCRCMGAVRHPNKARNLDDNHK